jgi:hypothetical protein
MKQVVFIRCYRISYSLTVSKSHLNVCVCAEIYWKCSAGSPPNAFRLCVRVKFRFQKFFLMAYFIIMDVKFSSLLCYVLICIFLNSEYFLECLAVFRISSERSALQLFQSVDLKRSSLLHCLMNQHLDHW